MAHKYKAAKRGAPAPADGCRCDVCRWVYNRIRNNNILRDHEGRVRPGTIEWNVLLQMADHNPSTISDPFADAEGRRAAQEDDR